MSAEETEQMINFLRSNGFLRTKPVEEAMRAIDRAYFVPDSWRPYTYSDNAIPIGYGQTISAPTVISYMLDYLDVKPGMKVLDIGTGSGYNTALLAYLIGPEGRLITIERIPEVMEIAKTNLTKLPIKFHNIRFIVADGSGGYEAEAPYDRIIVTAAIPELPPEHPLIKQLKSDGKLIAPVGRYSQDLLLYDNKTKTIQNILPVMFVPLIGKFGFKDGF